MTLEQHKTTKLTQSAVFDVVVLGGGAAGLFAAFTAAQRGRKVLVLERANKIGKKILMSGGGRCNFTNLYIEAQSFLSANQHFCKSALSQYTQWDFIDLMQQHGLEYEERKHGQLFCLHSAKELLAILEEECALTGVTIRTRCDVQDIESLERAQSSVDGTLDCSFHSSPNSPNSPNSSSPSACAERARYAVHCIENEITTHYLCESVIVATGALSVPTLGGSDRGYHLAQAFGLPLEDRSAGLVPFMFSDSMLTLCNALSGCSVSVEACCGSTRFNEDMLFTHRGLSGPAILQISNYWRPGETLTINLLPSLDAETYLIERKSESPKQKIRSVLTQHLPKALVTELEKRWWPEFSERALAECNDTMLRSLGQRLNTWQLKPSATEGYRTAEVTLGGVATSAISSKTMEAIAHPGLYFVGEVVDVTGHLGGFNFQWAWSSGFVAGVNA